MSNVKIEDYLHLYLGCECELSENNTTIKANVTCITIDKVKNGVWLCKPILRPLSDMTDWEAIELTKPITPYGTIHSYETWINTFGRIVVSWGHAHTQKYVPQSATAFLPEQFTYLLKQGFDLFGLIESGLAINKLTLNK